ncbi:CinA family protein [Salinisphaera sp. Q1T1-3]|uniref:CinA family protein n=1 Tax=Salinisphaera sp. Q1T1-3 TaxID=2321229 RepID=UPI000E74232B|nr:CinA family protein [Salinisphaera sp. Q1T1-3]RJS94440.1 CinA family protein [Salinisphaera sp. Q1T1-3]
MDGVTDPAAAIAETIDHLATLLVAHDARLVTAESCTGGLIASACTEVAGSSYWFERGYVTYSNAAKTTDLGVDVALLEQHGAVSAPVVAAMTAGALARTGSDWAIAVSGVAGPGGGSAEKPVGTVFIGWQAASQPADVVAYRFDGDRGAVRQASVLAALVGLRERIDRG